MRVCLDCDARDINDFAANCPECGGQHLRNPEDDYPLTCDEELGEHCIIPAFRCD